MADAPDLTGMTPDELRRELKRCARKDVKRAKACLDLWMEKTGHTIESLAGLVMDRLNAR